jgi:hypothetical protein
MREPDRSRILAENPKIDRARLEELERQLEELRRAGIQVDARNFAIDPPLGAARVEDQSATLRCESQIMPEEAPSGASLDGSRG